MQAMQEKEQVNHDKGLAARNIAEEFHDIMGMYHIIADRAARNRFFLPRNLRRDIKKINFIKPESHTVIYRCAEDEVTWEATRSKLRCLYCNSTFHRFHNHHELLQHLRTCHSMFRYTVSSSTRHDAIVIDIHLHSKSNTHKRPEPLFNNFIFEATLFYRPKRRLPTISQETTKTADGPKYKKPRIPNQSPNISSITGIGSAAGMSSVDGSATLSVPSPLTPTPSSPPHSKVKHASAICKREREKDRDPVRDGRKKSFRSIEHGIEQGRLFHSVDQTVLRVEKFEMQDSDDDDEVEQQWRYRIRQDEIIDFVDTIPTEMVLMNLWNQFVGLEYSVHSDRCIAPACKAFVEKYHKVLRRLQAEVSFVRFLADLTRIGLIDSDDVYFCVRRMKEGEGCNGSLEQENVEVNGHCNMNGHANDGNDSDNEMVEGKHKKLSVDTEHSFSYFSDEDPRCEYEDVLLKDDDKALKKDRRKLARAQRDH